MVNTRKLLTAATLLPMLGCFPSERRCVGPTCPQDTFVEATTSNDALSEPVASDVQPFDVLTNDIVLDSGLDAAVDNEVLPPSDAMDAMNAMEASFEPPLLDVIADETAVREVFVETGEDSACTPACMPDRCGDDGCGGWCECAPGRLCSSAGTCTPLSSTAQSCAPDADGGTPAGCGMIALPGGTITLGASRASIPERATPEQPGITVSPFLLDTHEVTVGRFRRWWAAGHPWSAPVSYPGVASPFLANDERLAAESFWSLWQNRQPVVFTPSRWNPARMLDETDRDRFSNDVESSHATWTPLPGPNENLPIAGVNYWMAFAFCAWDGGRLPTGAEFEYAVRYRPLGTLPAGRHYPWGNELPSCSGVGRVISSSCSALPLPFPDMWRLQRSRVPSVGGFYDLSGSVLEWVADVYTAYSDAECWGTRSLVDPLCLSRDGASIGNHDARGGNFASAFGDSMAGYSRGANYNGTRTTYGFRCARSTP